MIEIVTGVFVAELIPDLIPQEWVDSVLDVLIPDAWIDAAFAAWSWFCQHATVSVHAGPVTIQFA